MTILRICLLALLAICSHASAQEVPYPTRPVKVIVGYGPGGGTDIIARILAPAMAQEMGQPIIIENKPGASGIIGAYALAKAPPDGYTLMMGVVSLNALMPSLNSNLPYDTARDLVPVTLTASVPHFVAVNPSLPVKTLQELITYAKAHPNELSFPSAGNGTTPHIAGEIFMSLTGTHLLHVPYKSTGQSLPDLMSGMHKVSFDTYPTIANLVRTGRLRALAVTGAKRLPDFPDVPTAEEAGVKNFRISTWYGLFAPRGTRPSVIAYIHAKTAKALLSPSTAANLKEAGVDGTVTHSPEEFASLVQHDTERFARIIKAANIHLE
ncbi:Argininosuccinate lyase (plasmid) [Variovorax sp. SRS16]|uniref:Bug family tripartite tricarboxylate transporter substrate binding protein n=1 Tax=Variovorax sp. SRS16 TaxID=282217 RepID=UPI001318EA26|nr:tripartite tricarboxylate transporter substrate binding protein [Variovorax sp. SRS16]VTU46520.1 Argininosuccinate lyase [Variovorax sp. SRS16]